MVANSVALKTRLFILSLWVLCCTSPEKASAQTGSMPLSFDFFGETIELQIDPSVIVPFDSTLNDEAIQTFYASINNSRYQPIIQSLLDFKLTYKLDDWLYYQLIRKTAQQVSPKTANYYRYTLYKWFLLNKSGYDATLSISQNKLLFYVQSDEEIYNLPYHTKNGKQYVCLNYHDYGGNIDFHFTPFHEIPLYFPEAQRAFTYKVTQLPGFSPEAYKEKEIRFTYYENEYRFRVKLNPEIAAIFANYPVVDYSSFFNIPLSKETYKSLIPELKKILKSMNQKNGVDFLMHFTRYAFLFEPDRRQFGGEKRLTPEQTLLYEKSDCEDRAALLFYLVKEIYNLPMIVLSYPHHITMAVKFDKPVGTPIVFQGEKYSICEPTPQKQYLSMGQLLPELHGSVYQVVYAYNPSKAEQNNTRHISNKSPQ